MTEWRERARHMLGLGVERLRDEAMGWIRRATGPRSVVFGAQAGPEVERPGPSPRLVRALTLLRQGMGVGREGARRVRRRLGRTVMRAGLRLPGAVLAVVSRPSFAPARTAAPVEPRSEDRPGIPHEKAAGSVRSGFFQGPVRARRPGSGDPSQLRAFGRDAWTLLILWEVRPGLRPGHLSRPSLELRVRTLDGVEVLRREIDVRGSLYVEELVPGQTYIVELWWTEGEAAVPLAMPPATVRLPAGPPTSISKTPISFGRWTASAEVASPLDAGPTGRPSSAPTPSWLQASGPLGSGTEHLVWAGSMRSGAGRHPSSFVGSPGRGGPSSPGLGAGSGSGWGTSGLGPPSSLHGHGPGGRARSGFGPTSPTGAWRARGVLGSWGPTPAGGVAASGTDDVSALIRAPRPPRSVGVRAPATPVAPASAPPSAGAHVAPARKGATPHAGGQPPAPASKGPRRAGKGRERRRRLARAEAQKAAGTDAAPVSIASTGATRDEVPVRRGFFESGPHRGRARSPKDRG